MIQQRSSLESFVQPFDVEVPDLGHLERAFTHTNTLTRAWTTAPVCSQLVFRGSAKPQRI